MMASNAEKITQDHYLNLVKENNSYIGTRVKRGKDWIYGNQDYHLNKPGMGTIIERRDNGTVRVQWDNGTKSCCFAGSSNFYDLSLATDDIEFKKPKHEKTLEWSSDTDFINVSNMICEKELSQPKEYTIDTPNLLKHQPISNFSNLVTPLSGHLLDQNQKTDDMKFRYCPADDEKVTDYFNAVIVDIETSGLRKNCDILQIGIVDLYDDSKIWSQYIEPTQPIDRMASAVNHLAIVNDKLFYRNKQIKDIVSSSQAMQNFMDYLTQNYPTGVILIAHNGNRFDFRHIGRYLEILQNKSNMKVSELYDFRCIDTLQVFKQNFPGESSYSQRNILGKFVRDTELKDDHEAIGDCINLKYAITNAAKRKSMTVKQFLGEPNTFERFLSRK